jgi:predicted GNAT family acetyltransferase
MTDVVRNDEEHRYELSVDDALAVLQYRLNGERLVLVHTEVPETLEGRGVGSRLVRAAIDDARESNLIVVPMCPFARAWLERHPDVAATARVDWPPKAGACASIAWPDAGVTVRRDGDDARVRWAR